METAFSHSRLPRLLLEFLVGGSGEISARAPVSWRVGERACEGRFQYRLQDPGEEGDKRVILSVGSREGAKGSPITFLLV